MSEQSKKSFLDNEREHTPYGTIEFRSHTADLTVDIRSHSPQDMFRAAAWALARVQVEDWPQDLTKEEKVEIISDDWDDAIVNWLNHLIFVAEKNAAFWTEVDFEELSDTVLRATVKGCPWPENPEALGREVKAASYFGVEVIPGPSLWQARVTFDL